MIWKDMWIIHGRINGSSVGIIEMTIKKVFVNNNNQAIFVCPKCEKAKTADVSRYKKLRQSVRVKYACKCGHVCSVLLERRQYYRKETYLSGVYELRTGNLKNTMIIKDISPTGLRFEITSKRDFNIGNNLIVEFKFDDDDDSTAVNKEVFVRSICDNMIGVEFHFPIELSPFDIA